MPKNDLNFEDFRRLHRLALEKKFPGRTQSFWGQQNSTIVIVGQAPSQSGIKFQKPWFDKSGDRIRDSWLQVHQDQFYNQNLFYLTALGLYFPGKNKKGGDLKPSLDWAEKWLRKEISYLSPELYLIVGAMASNFFFPGRKFEELIFGDLSLNERPAFVLPHPSPLNIKWFKDHPQFEKRILVVRSKVDEVLYNADHGSFKNARK